MVLSVNEYRKISQDFVTPTEEVEEELLYLNKLTYVLLGIKNENERDRTNEINGYRNKASKKLRRRQS
jgi:hypothetical protein